MIHPKEYMSISWVLWVLVKEISILDFVFFRKYNEPKGGDDHEKI